MDDTPGARYFDSIAKLAARLDAELERYDNVGADQEADFAAIGDRFGRLRTGDSVRYGLWLRLALTAAQLRGAERGTVPGVAADICALAVDLVDLANLTPGDRIGYVKEGELDQLAGRLEMQAAICRELAKLIRAG